MYGGKANSSSANRYCSKGCLQANDPKCASYYDFEVNTGIKDKSASNAYHTFQTLTEAEKKEMEPEVYNRLVANQRKHTVNYTNTENLGIIRVIARLLLNNIRLIDLLCDMQLIGEQSGKPSLLNLYIELACHIKMRKENGNISLLDYDKYLYSLDSLAKEKDKLKSIDNLNKRAKEEYKLLDAQNLSYRLNNGRNKLLPSFDTLRYIDNIFPPKN